MIFLTRLQNRVTDQVPADIRTLILHLFQTYIKITSKQLQNKYNQVSTMTYNLIKPITVFFDEVINQRKLGELAKKSCTPSQIMDLNFRVISNYPIYRDNERRWLRQPPVDQKYPDLIDFFKRFTRSHAKRRRWLKNLSFNWPTSL